MVAVDGSSYFQLLNPLVLGMFAGGFLAIWRYDGSQRSALVLGVAYTLGSIGFTLDFFLRDVVPAPFEPFVSNVFFLASVALISASFHLRFAGRVPALALAVTIGTTLLLVGAFHFVRPDIALRSLTMNFGTAILFAVGCLAFRGRALSIAERFAFAGMLLSVTHCVARPVGLLAVGSFDASALAYSDSVYALTLHFASAISALMIAAAMLFALGADLVGRLSEIGVTDPLTGLRNRRGLDAYVESLRGERGPLAASIVIADIDHFKPVNDRFGHAAGDVVLRSFAHVLRGATGGRGVAARVGGEEFLIVLPHTEAPLARLAAEGARTAFEAMSHGVLDGGRVTASFGIAPWSVDEPFQNAVARADMALYEAKREGRNRISLAAAAPDVSGRLATA